jgi:hypothetical protein
MTTVHLNATVGPDGALDVHIPDLPPGLPVSITVESDRAATPATMSNVHMIDLIKDLPGHRLFQSAEAVDDYLRQERDAWDR